MTSSDSDDSNSSDSSDNIMSVDSSDSETNSDKEFIDKINKWIKIFKFKTIIKILIKNSILLIFYFNFLLEWIKNYQFDNNLFINI